MQNEGETGREILCNLKGRSAGGAVWERRPISSARAPPAAHSGQGTPIKPPDDPKIFEDAKPILGE